MASYPQIILKSLSSVLNATDFFIIGETEACCGSRSEGSKDIKRWVAKQTDEKLYQNT